MIEFKVTDGVRITTYSVTPFETYAEAVSWCFTFCDVNQLELIAIL